MALLAPVAGGAVLAVVAGVFGDVVSAVVGALRAVFVVTVVLVVVPGVVAVEDLVPGRSQPAIASDASAAAVSMVIGFMMSPWGIGSFRTMPPVISAFFFAVCRYGRLRKSFVAYFRIESAAKRPTGNRATRP